mmetsp:Transcript_16195/g.39496  ORF Transcript_16195/g.39496 Transcript_16195/m.39496 type:complete len:208 (+) Transcript_16195:780-1403(+)
MGKSRACIRSRPSPPVVTHPSPITQQHPFIIIASNSHPTRTPPHHPIDCITIALHRVLPAALHDGYELLKRVLVQHVVDGAQHVLDVGALELVPVHEEVLDDAVDVVQLARLLLDLRRDALLLAEDLLVLLGQEVQVVLLHLDLLEALDERALPREVELVQQLGVHQRAEVRHRGVVQVEADVDAHLQVGGLARDVLLEQRQRRHAV